MSGEEVIFKIERSDLGDSQKHQVRSSLLDAIQAPDPERGKSLYVEEAGDEASGSLAWSYHVPLLLSI